MSTAVYAVASVLAVVCRVLLKRAVVAYGHMHEWQAHTHYSVVRGGCWQVKARVLHDVPVGARQNLNMRE